MGSPGRTLRRLRISTARCVEYALRRPLLVVLVFSSAVALLSATAIWTRRPPGTFDPDELGYLATALRFERVLSPWDPGALLGEAMGTVLGPLVPLLSLPFLVVGPRDPRTALLVQPLLLVVVAVATTGIARRMVGPGWAVLTGCYVAALPTVVLASQAYWLGLGAAAAMALSVWALLSSEGLTNRWTMAFGLGMGALALSRTMALAFVPGLFLAGLLLGRRHPHGVRNLMGATALGAAVAAPWYLVQREEIFGYLVTYGFGDEAAEWGSGNVVQRLLTRIVQVLESAVMVPAWWAMAVAMAAVAVGGAVVVPRLRTEWHAEPVRSATSVLVVAAAGLVALLTTTNEGVWFELPLVVLVVPAGLALVARAPVSVRRPAGVAAAVLAVMVPVTLFVMGTAHSDGAFEASDPRFADTAAERRHAAAEWTELHSELTDELAALTERGEDGIIAVTGNTFLLNSNSVEYTAEIDGWRAEVQVPQTFGIDAADLEPLPVSGPQLGADGEPATRYLVVARHDLPLFTPDRGWRELEVAVRAEGWEPVWRRQLPVGGDVVILRPPEERNR